MKKVVICKEKLKGNESLLSIKCMLSAHQALRENGLISSRVNLSISGEPESIETMFELSEFDNGKLQKGQRYAYILNGGEL
jgi:hypothetical protein